MRRVQGVERTKLKSEQGGILVRVKRGETLSRKKGAMESFLVFNQGFCICTKRRDLFALFIIQA